MAHTHSVVDADKHFVIDPVTRAIANQSEKLVLMQGENAAPVHAHCRCSVAAHEDSKEYEEWLEFIANGGTTEEWEKLKKNTFQYKNTTNKDMQNYKSVTLDNNDKITSSYKNLPCTATRMIGYDNEIYISDKIKLKPKQVSYVNARINKAASLVGAKSSYKKPRIIICDTTEMPTRTIAAYTASDNTLRISDIITSKEGVLKLPKDGACHSNHNSIYVHEMLHWSDAQEYIRTHGDSEGYIKSNIKAGKTNIDKLIKSGYNAVVLVYMLILCIV